MLLWASTCTICCQRLACCCSSCGGGFLIGHQRLDLPLCWLSSELLSRCVFWVPVCAWRLVLACKLCGFEVELLSFLQEGCRNILRYLRQALLSWRAS